MQHNERYEQRAAWLRTVWKKGAHLHEWRQEESGGEKEGKISPKVLTLEFSLIA